jgi:hypothetical protein
MKTNMHLANRCVAENFGEGSGGGLMVQFRKVERAKVIIQDGKELFLKTCLECQREFYGDQKIMRCDLCRGRG